MLTVMTSPLTSEIASLEIVTGFGELPGVVVAQDDSLSVEAEPGPSAEPLLESVSHCYRSSRWAKNGSLGQILDLTPVW